MSKYINLFIILILASACNSINKNVETKSNTHFIDEIIRNPTKLYEIKYNDSMKLYGNPIFKYTENSIFNSFSKLKICFDTNYQIFSEKLFFSKVNNCYLNHVMITNTDSSSFFEFRFAYINNNWYLYSAEEAFRYMKYLIILPNQESVLIPSKCVDNIETIKSMLRDSLFAMNEFENSKKVGDFLYVNSTKILGNDLEKSSFSKFRKRIDNRDFKVIAEKCFSTIDNKLINYRICIEFIDEGEAFFSFIFIDNQWYLDCWQPNCFMRPFNPQSDY